MCLSCHNTKHISKKSINIQYEKINKSTAQLYHNIDP